MSVIVFPLKSKTFKLGKGIVGNVVSRLKEASSEVVEEGTGGGNSETGGKVAICIPERQRRELFSSICSLIAALIFGFVERPGDFGRTDGLSPDSSEGNSTLPTAGQPPSCSGDLGISTLPAAGQPPIGGDLQDFCVGLSGVFLGVLASSCCGDNGTCCCGCRWACSALVFHELPDSFVEKEEGGVGDLDLPREEDSKEALLGDFCPVCQFELGTLFSFVLSTPSSREL
mmetsp:Transcript_6961/g.10541  ORF Transcript_6961/g.10541 Transcript_6961/m.10541 type:complete len:229 (+) Transcript_6961:1324-2010(+)